MEDQAKDAELVFGGMRALSCARDVLTIQIPKEIKQVLMGHKFPKRKGVDERPTRRACILEKRAAVVTDGGLRL
jgi:hypothetical protein